MAGPFLKRVGLVVDIRKCRSSAKHGPNGSFGLTLKNESGLSNYLIEKDGSKMQLKGSPVSFDTLDSLVAYFSAAARYPLSIRLAGGTDTLDTTYQSQMYGEIGGLDVTSGLDYL